MRRQGSSTFAHTQQPISVDHLSRTRGPGLARHQTAAETRPLAYQPNASGAIYRSYVQLHVPRNQQRNPGDKGGGTGTVDTVRIGDIVCPTGTYFTQRRVRVRETLYPVSETQQFFN